MQNGFYFYNSNDLNSFVDSFLIDCQKNPLKNIFQPEVFLVQSKGMEKWFRLLLARKTGISVNMNFPFPNKFFGQLFDYCNHGQEDSYNKLDLAFRIMKILPQLLDDPDFLLIKNFLDADSREFRLWQISINIADTFDQYLFFRPDWILKWEKEESVFLDNSLERWQAKLWRLLRIQDNFASNRLTNKISLIEMLQKKDEGLLALLPERISILGIPNLPKFYLDILKELSSYIRINFYFFNPSKEYWGDIRSNREIFYALKEEEQKDYNLEELYFENGHPLIASCGKVGRDLLWQILDSFPEIDYLETFTEQKDNSILDILKNKILALDDNCEKNIITENYYQDDGSLVINSCHSPKREVEVLHNYLVKLFKENPNLNPADVVVMSTSIDNYTAHINSVFSENKIFPYSIADRSLLKESSFVESFFAILDIFSSRYTSEDLMALLDYDEILEKFDLTVEDLSLIRYWIQETAICWGIDDKFKDNFDLPVTFENTWEQGLQRLILGSAFLDDENTSEDVLIPFCDLEGNNTEVLGKFLDFYSLLKKYYYLFKKEYTLEEWAQNFKSVLDDFYTENLQTEDRSYEFLISRLDSIAKIEEKYDFGTKCNLSVIKTVLMSQISDYISSQNFLNGGITFCEILPMRSIPFKVVCLLGMNDGAFPRITPVGGINLMSQFESRHRRGDRSLKDEDRYLFLESLVSTKQNFYLSYVGQSTKDNTVREPSILIRELLDYLQNFCADDLNVYDVLIQRHRLHSFNPVYFLEKNQNYSQKDYDIARQLISREENFQQNFFVGKSFESQKDINDLTIQNLSAFFRDPVKYFCNYNYKINYQLKENNLNVDENFEIERLDEYGLATNIYEEMLYQGKSELPDKNLLFQKLRGKSLLPHQNLGKFYFSKVYDGFGSFAKKINPQIFTDYRFEFLQQEILVPKKLFLAGNFLLNEQQNESARIFYSKLSGNRLLEVWLEHLFLQNYLSTELTSISYFKDQTITFSCPKNDVRSHLESLINLYFCGLSEPLPFNAQFCYDAFSSVSEKKSFFDIVHKGFNSKQDYTIYNYTKYDELIFGNLENFISPTMENLTKEIFVPLKNNMKELS